MTLDWAATAAGLLPALAWGAFLCARAGSPARALACLAAGALALLPACLAENALPAWAGWGRAGDALAAGLLEPALLVLAAALLSGEGRTPRGLGRLCACAALGFAAAEGALYGALYGWGASCARALASVPAHAADGFLAGLVAGRLGGGRTAWAAGWGAAALSHCAFDLLALSPLPHGGDMAAISGWAVCMAAGLLWWKSPDGMDW